MSQLVRTALDLTPWWLRGKIRNIPVLAALQRAIVSRSLDGKQFEHLVTAGPAKGIRFLVQMPDDKGIWTGTYEQHFSERIAAHVKPGMVAYDIGSWHGFFAGVMAAQGAKTVHMFEPLPANIARIEQLIALNPECDIRLHACAVGDEETRMDLIVMPQTSMAKLEHSTFQKGRGSDRKISVDVRTIDRMVEEGEIAPPGLMKVDVEGADLMVLTGARRTIAKYRPHIFFEAHSSMLRDQCSRLLEGEGYRLISLDEDEQEAVRRDVFQFHAVPA